MAKLIVLGSSSSRPFPRAMHDDTICNAARQGGKSRRTRAALAMVLGKTEERVILIEAGPDVVGQLRRFRLRPDAVIVNHDHVDAGGGLKYLPAVRAYRESDGSLSPGVEFDLWGVRVLPFRVAHAKDVKTIGLRLVVGGKVVVYCSDISSLWGIKKNIKQAEVVFADGSSWAVNMGTHVSMVDQLTAYKKWGVKRVIFTHVGHRTAPHEELEKMVKAVYDRAEVAWDGMEVVLE